jgi:lysophospholipase L1-like esterase
MLRLGSIALILLTHPTLAQEKTQATLTKTPPAQQIQGRFAQEITKLAAIPPAPGSIIFTGSSSIRRWPNLKADFPDLPVINCGFGGCHITDVADRFDLLIARHTPKLLVIYAGGNDLAEGKTVDETFLATTRLILHTRKTLPNTRIRLLSLKIAPQRAHLAPHFHTLNQKLQHWSANQPNLRWVDASSCLTTPENTPDTTLFDPDNLHLNPAGYAKWKATIDPIIRQEWANAQ